MFIGFWEIIEESLARGESIELRGYGSFRIQDRPARNVRNPATGELLYIEARKVPVFKPSKDFKERVHKAASE